MHAMKKCCFLQAALSECSVALIVAFAGEIVVIAAAGLLWFECAWKSVPQHLCMDNGHTTNQRIF